jgi:hypothetical protein
LRPTAGAFAAEVVARSSATFLRLAALAPAGLPVPGSYAGHIETSGGSAPCAVRVLDDRATVWCQPRAAFPPAAPGQGARVTVFANPGSGR